MEYWELEQAKLKAASASPPFREGAGDRCRERYRARHRRDASPAGRGRDGLDINPAVTSVSEARDAGADLCVTMARAQKRSRPRSANSEVSTSWSVTRAFSAQRAAGGFDDATGSNSHSISTGCFSSW